jgi:hypothetical protein
LARVVRDRPWVAIAVIVASINCRRRGSGVLPGVLAAEPASTAVLRLVIVSRVMAVSAKFGLLACFPRSAKPGLSGTPAPVSDGHREVSA